MCAIQERLKAQADRIGIPIDSLTAYLVLPSLKLLEAGEVFVAQNWSTPEPINLSNDFVVRVREMAEACNLDPREFIEDFVRDLLNESSRREFGNPILDGWTYTPEEHVECRAKLDALWDRWHAEEKGDHTK